ncbi:hypothetical protein, partial [Glaesserella parasuis]|uniref:hypothetical protein n=1 Tax=Glaesserella parasuis TaxID=738 RepID=UPI003B7DD291
MKLHEIANRLSQALPTALLAITAVAAHGQTQQTPIPEHMSLQPQIDFAGTGIATLDFGRNKLFGS